VLVPEQPPLRVRLHAAQGAAAAAPQPPQWRRPGGEEGASAVVASVPAQQQVLRQRASPTNTPAAVSSKRGLFWRRTARRARNRTAARAQQRCALPTTHRCVTAHAPHGARAGAWCSSRCRCMPPADAAARR
jgi:hypothetical protein